MKKALLILILSFSTFSVYSQGASDVELAMQFYKNGDWEKALTLYRGLFEKTKQSEYYDQYLDVLLKLKKYAEAKELVGSMLREQPALYAYKVDYGRILQEQGEQEKADNWYKGLLKEMPSGEYAVRELAMAFYRANAYDYSVKAFLTGRKLLKDEHAFSFELISLYRFQKDKPMLVKEYVDLLGSTPEQALLNQAKNTLASVLESPEDFSLLKSSVLTKSQKGPYNPVYSELLAWVYVQQKDFGQALKETIALDKKLNEEGDQVFDLILLLTANKAYSIATQGLQYLVSKGPGNQYYVPAKIQNLQIQYQVLTEGTYTSAQLKEMQDAYLNLLKEFGRTRNTVFAIRQLASLQAFYLNKPSDAEVLLEEALKIPQLPLSVKGQTKLELGDIYILTGELWEAALIYGQVEKEFPNEPIGQEAKFRNAKLSYYQGEFDWAKAQLDVLKSSTSQLIANDALNLGLLIAENTASSADTNALVKFAFADRLSFANQADRAISVLDSIDILYPGNSLSDDILMSKSRIYIKQNELQKAIVSLKNIIERYSYDIWADDAVFLLAELYETRLHDIQSAKFYYQKIIADYPGSLFANEARKRFRNLRGDTLG